MNLTSPFGRIPMFFFFLNPGRLPTAMTCGNLLQLPRAFGDEESLGESGGDTYGAGRLEWDL